MLWMSVGWGQDQPIKVVSVAPDCYPTQDGILWQTIVIANQAVDWWVLEWSSIDDGYRYKKVESKSWICLFRQDAKILLSVGMRSDWIKMDIKVTKDEGIIITKYCDSTIVVSTIPSIKLWTLPGGDKVDSLVIKEDNTLIAYNIPCGTGVAYKRISVSACPPDTVQNNQTLGNGRQQDPVTQTENPIKKVFSVYPNPWISGPLTVGLPEGQTIEKVMIYNLTGKIVFEGTTETILTDLPAGLYVLRVFVGGGFVYLKKILKQ